MSLPRVPPPTADPDLVLGGHPIYLVWHHPTILRAWKNPDGTMSAKIDRSSVPSIPRGALIGHKDQEGRGCVLWLPWTVDPEHADMPTWTLESLRPLTIKEAFACGRCGMVGAIRDGDWWWWHAETASLMRGSQP